jgi:hypothetical protein
MSQILPPRFLFRFSAPCRRLEEQWSERGLPLGDEFRLPNFGELEGAPPLADVRVGWSEQGLAFNVRVEGKRHTPWCRPMQLDASDGFHVWLDTRDTHNIHRASRFCHRFVFLPSGGGSRGSDPLAAQLTIHRAKEQARPAKSSQLHVRSKVVSGGYSLEAFIEAAALTGYDPTEHPRLGFTYALADRERGDQTFSAGKEFPYEENPSVWGTLELERASA